MRAQKFGEPALAAHQVIGLAEDPQFAFQDPVQVITFTYGRGVVGIEEQMFKASEELAGS